jgi:hypothetical protein
MSALPGPSASHGRSTCSAAATKTSSSPSSVPGRLTLARVGRAMRWPPRCAAEKPQPRNPSLVRPHRRMGGIAALRTALPLRPASTSFKPTLADAFRGRFGVTWGHLKYHWQDSGSGSQSSSPCPAASGSRRSGGGFVFHTGQPTGGAHRSGRGRRVRRSRRGDVEQSEQVGDAEHHRVGLASPRDLMTGCARWAWGRLAR